MNQESPTNNYYFKISRKEILFLILLWLLLFLEPIPIGPLKISQIWKSLVVVVLSLFVLKEKLPRFIFIGILFSLKFLIYKHFPYGFLQAVQDALESMIFPIFLGFLFVAYRNKDDASERLTHIAILLSLFLIYSAVPFVFGLQSLNPITELDKYGIEAKATKGLFYQIATSSKLFTIATIVLINLYKRFSNTFLNKTIWLGAILLGSYFVYTSWTRTGWLIFLVALLISFFYGANLKRKLSAALASIILCLGVVVLFQSSQAFRWRLTGGTSYRTNTELTVQQLASSRLPFIVVAIDNLKEEGTLGQIIGYGTQHGIDLFEEKTRMSIVSHNRTFEILESSGIIALTLYIIFIWSLFKKVLRQAVFAPPELKKLAIISMVMFFGFYFTSHGTPLWGEIIYSCFFVAILVGNTASKKAVL